MRRPRSPGRRCASTSPTSPPRAPTPFGYLLSLALPEDWTESWLAGFARGLKGDQERYGVTLIGGDTIRASGGLTVSVTALGRIPKGRMVTRAGARPGDAIFVSGTIGDAALGLAVRLGRIDAGEGRGTKHLLDRYLHPAAAHGAGADPAPPCLERHGCLRRPRRRSRPYLRRLRRRRRDRGGAGAAVAGGAAPALPATAALLAHHRHRRRRLRDPGHGERARRRRASPPRPREAGVPVTRIGRIVEGKGPPRLLDATGQPIRLDGAGHTHF